MACGLIGIGCRWLLAVVDAVGAAEDLRVVKGMIDTSSASVDSFLELLIAEALASRGFSFVLQSAAHGLSAFEF